MQHETDGEMTFLGLVTINTTLLLSTLFHHSSTLHRLKGMPSIRYNSLHEFDNEDEIEKSWNYVAIFDTHALSATSRRLLVLYIRR